MRKRKSNNSHQQQPRTTVNVNVMAHTLGVPPIKLRKWLRARYGRREVGEWPREFTEKPMTFEELLEHYSNPARRYWEEHWGW